MSRSISLKRSCVGVAVAGVCIAAPTAASAVNLGTAQSFAVLGGASVTNTGPTVLNGDLGISPGTSITGFGSPAFVNGATHPTDAVAGIAQNDLTTAYNVAAGLPAGDLTGIDLGGLTLQAGAYNFSSSAGLTGNLTLDAAGNPNAEFVFEIGSTLITAPGSSVTLINGASPCNVYWQVGSSATLDTTTAFVGNIMALSDITLNDGASVQGRVLAQTGGAVDLHNNVISMAGCPTGNTGGSGGSGGSGGTGSSGVPPASTSTVPTRLGTATLRRAANLRGGPGSPPGCTAGFTATVTGKKIKQVTFNLDGKRIAVRNSAPAKVKIRSLTGNHSVTARVTFTDATKTLTRKLRYRACGAAKLSPRPGVSAFTG